MRDFAMVYPAALGLISLAVLVLMAHVSAWQSAKRKEAAKHELTRTKIASAMAELDKEPFLPNLTSELAQLLAILEASENGRVPTRREQSQAEI